MPTFDIQFMTVPEAAKALQVAESTLRHQIKNGKLAARKISRDWFIAADEVARYGREHKVPPASVPLADTASDPPTA